MSLFAMGITLAQSVEDWSFTPPTTDNNMSVVFPAGTLNDFTGGFLMAFVDGQPVSAGSEIALDGSGGVAVIGTDNLCECDLADSGETISFAVLLNGTIIVIANVDPPVTYAGNTFHMISSETITFTIDGNPVAFGCMDDAYIEYNSDANAAETESCVTLIEEGCMDVLADNHNPTANVDDDSCLFTGCMEPSADNYLDYANVSDDCIYYGCIDETACNYSETANTDNGTCEGLIGCTDDSYYEYNENSTCDDGSCESLIVPGCTDVNPWGIDAFNYNADATFDDGSCYPVILGCINPSADNYDAPFGDVMVDANTDDSPTLCVYSGINPWGAGGATEEAPSYVTSNNMSVLFPIGNTVWDDSDLNAGDVLFAVYETGRLENEMLGYSEVSNVQSAGAVVWTGDQVGMSIFGADNNELNGFQEYESLTWLVKSAGVIYNVSVEITSANSTGLYEDGDYVLVSSITKGSPFYDGCTDAIYANFNPMANTPDGTCSTPFSIGCTDISKVNFAGVGANPTHISATNFGDAFGENVGYDLITGAQEPTGIAANISDDSMCQAQVEGCTDPMAMNYDSQATENTNTVCDWTIGGMMVYDVDENGVMIESEDNYVYAEHFANYSILIADGSIDEDAHLAVNLASVMEWIDADELDDEALLQNTIEVAEDLLDATTNSLNETIDALIFDYDTQLDAEATSALELLTSTTNSLNNSIDALILDYDAQLDAEATSALELLTSTTNSLNDSIDALILDYGVQLSDAATDAENAANAAQSTLESQITADSIALTDTVVALNEVIDYYSAPIVINLHEQWNTIGYYLHHPSPVVAQFAAHFDDLGGVSANIRIVKNNEGSFYWPEFDYDGLLLLEPGQGYQVRVKEDKGSPNFIFDLNLDADDLRLLIPSVPTWAIEMETESHPNDIRTLVRVVNMLGQEVNPTEQFNGEVLLYMYNDGTVEKKMVE